MTSHMSCSTSSTVTPRSRIRPMQPGQLGGLAHVEAGGRLVEEQERRVGGQRPGQLHGPLLPVGEAAWPRRRPARRCRAKLQRLAGPARRSPAPRRQVAGRWSRPARKPARLRRWRADHDVLERRHPGEEPDVLEGAGDAAARPPGAAAARGAPRRRSRTSPASGAATPETRLKSVVLPAPLGPMTALMRARPDVEADVLDGLDAAEALGDAAHLEQRVTAPPRSAPRRARAARPGPGRALEPQDPVGREEHDHEQDRAEDGVVVGAEVAAQREEVEHHAGGQRAPQAAHAAHRDDGHVADRLHHRGLARADAAVVVGEEDAAERGQRRREDEGGELVAGRRRRPWRRRRPRRRGWRAAPGRPATRPGSRAAASPAATSPQAT